MIPRYARPILVAFSLLAAFPAAAADDVPAPTIITDDAVEWSLQVEATSVVVVIRGPEGVEVRRAFAQGQTPRFTAGEAAHLGLPDGEYTYEILIVTPDVDPDVPGAQVALTQSGPFAIVEGAFAAMRGPVITGDQTIRDSICVGFDCLDVESYGFDTVRLKENNLRIHFNDTSVSAGFPLTDWEITINDSQSGGDSYFQVRNLTDNQNPFRIDAGAPTNALWIDAEGDVGLGTATPVLELEISDGDTPAVRLEQTPNFGFTAQTWDVAGNEANFFIRDVTGGSRLPFRILPGAATGLVSLTTAGVGIGVGSTGGAADVGSVLDVFGTTRLRSTLQVDGNSTLGGRLSVMADFSAAGNNIVFAVVNTAVGTPLMSLRKTGDLTISGTLNQLSDATVKENVVPVDVEAVLAGVGSLPIATWSYIADDESLVHLGPMAQDFRRAFGLGQGETTIATVDADGVALASIQALLARSEADRQRIAELEAEAARLAERLARIEALLGARDK